MGEVTRIEVCVVLAEAGRHTTVRLCLPAGATVGDALSGAGLLEQRRDLDRGSLGLAIYGKAVDPDRVLEAGDRVEVLRPLVHEPRSRRRQLAREGRTMGTSERKR